MRLAPRLTHSYQGALEAMVDISKGAINRALQGPATAAIQVSTLAFSPTVPFTYAQGGYQGQGGYGGGY